MRRKITKYLLKLAVLVPVIMVLGRSIFALADTASAPSLIISQLKITSSNGQFVTLYNTTNTSLDLSKYQLQYFNNYDLTKATSSRQLGLSGSLPAHGYFMVSDALVTLCYQMIVDSQSLGFSSTAGMIEVLAYDQTLPGGGVSSSLQDSVGWSKTAATGAQTLPSNTSAFLMRKYQDGSNNPTVLTPGGGSWQQVTPDTLNPCRLVTIGSTTTAVSLGSSQLLPSSAPPAEIISVVATDSGVDGQASIPAADVGLLSPQITELLPNPTGTGNDNIDEFIEIYNPNAAAFDLSGFSLQTGLNTLHTYKFPAGSKLGSKSFTAFYSEQTGLSLSNTSSQARLLDPFGSAISEAPTYVSAKDGQAWALGNGKWYWTTAVTPDAANKIVLPPAAKSKKKSTAKSKNSRSTKPAKAETSAVSGSADAKPQTFPIHNRTLVLVGAGALLYAIYEYRTDLGNRLHQLRQHLGDRRAGRATAAGRRSD